jgi:hypothetical protein
MDHAKATHRLAEGSDVLPDLKIESRRVAKPVAAE